MKRYTLALLATFLAPAQPVSAIDGERPDFVGSYSYQGQCAAEYQCALEIAPTHRPQSTDTVLVKFIIADRLDYSVIQKSISLYMRNTQDDRLVAGLAGHVIEISRQANGDLIVTGLPERNGVALIGTYIPLGD